MAYSAIALGDQEQPEMRAANEKGHRFRKLSPFGEVTR
jgi:hypothetical protein